MLLPSDRVNANFRNYMDNFTDIDDGLYVEDDKLLSIVFNIISNKDEVLRSILNMFDESQGSAFCLSYKDKRGIVVGYCLGETYYWWLS